MAKLQAPVCRGRQAKSAFPLARTVEAQDTQENKSCLLPVEATGHKHQAVSARSHSWTLIAPSTRSDDKFPPLHNLVRNLAPPHQHHPRAHRLFLQVRRHVQLFAELLQPPPPLWLPVPLPLPLSSCCSPTNPEAALSTHALTSHPYGSFCPRSPPKPVTSSALPVGLDPLERGPSPGPRASTKLGHDVFWRALLSTGQNLRPGSHQPSPGLNSTRTGLEPCPVLI